jgi:clan AA aspartic protease
MIAGRVTDDFEVAVALTIVGPNGDKAGVDAAIDSGFTAELTLPRTIVDGLGLEQVRTEPIILADGTPIEVDVYECRVTWDGKQRAVRAHCMDGGVLIGMSLLIGYRVRFDVIHNGPVLVSELP